MKRASLLLMLLSTLVGCQLTHVEGEIDDVKVKVSTKDHDNEKDHEGNGKFCPPGQAKKGNC